MPIVRWMRGISINTDLRALTSNAAISRASRLVDKSLERLATGQKINRASDDPSGMIAVEGFKGRIKEINEEIKSLDTEEKWLGARDGAISVVSDMLVELQSLVVASANTGAMSEDERDAIQQQANGIIDGIDFVTRTSEFNGRQLLDGFGSMNLGQTQRTITNADGSQATQSLSLASLRSGGLLNLIDGDREAAQSMADSLVSWASGQRAAIGNYAKTIDSKRDTLRVELENITQMKSLIGDTDYAAETSELVRGQILQQMSIATRQIATDSRQETVMSLLQGAMKR